MYRLHVTRRAPTRLIIFEASRYKDEGSRTSQQPCIGQRQSLVRCHSGRMWHISDLEERFE